MALGPSLLGDVTFYLYSVKTKGVMVCGILPHCLNLYRLFCHCNEGSEGDYCMDGCEDSLFS